MAGEVAGGFGDNYENSYKNLLFWEKPAIISLKILMKGNLYEKAPCIGLDLASVCRAFDIQFWAGQGV